MKTNEINDQLLKKYKKHIDVIRPLEKVCSGQWAHKGIEAVKDYMTTGSKPEFDIVPIYHTGTNYPNHTPNLFMVDTKKGVQLLVQEHVYRAKNITERVLGVIDGGVITLMNTRNLVKGDYAYALAALIGNGSFHENQTDFPLNPLRYTYAKTEYPVADGMQFKYDSAGKIGVISSAKDLKVRSNRKVTNKVNKEFKEFLDNAKVMAKLMKPVREVGNTDYNWDNAIMTKYAKDHLGLDNRLRYHGYYDSNGLINNAQKLFTGGDFAPSIDEETGIITPTKGFEVPERIFAAAKENNFAPAAYLLLEDSGTSMEKRILNAFRALNGGFYIGE